MKPDIVFKTIWLTQCKAINLKTLNFLLSKVANLQLMDCTMEGSIDENFSVESLNLTNSSLVLLNAVKAESLKQLSLRCSWFNS